MLLVENFTEPMRLGVVTIVQLEARRADLEREIAEHLSRSEAERSQSTAARQQLEAQLDAIRKTIVATEELALLQEAGVYRYRHPLSDAVANASRPHT